MKAYGGEQVQLAVGYHKLSIINIEVSDQLFSVITLTQAEETQLVHE
jgi:hypothetical protein